MASSGGVKLTPFAKGFIALVVVAVIGFVSWYWFKDDLKCIGDPTAEGCEGATADGDGDGDGDGNGGGDITADDFDGLNGAPADPHRNAPHNVQKNWASNGFVYVITRRWFYGISNQPICSNNLLWISG